MDTYEKIEKIKEEQSRISEVMLNTYKEYGWIFDERNSSDIKSKTICGCTMTIEDGYCPDIIGALTFIYGQAGSIFEGRVETPEEVILLMKMLGFEKI